MAEANTLRIQQQNEMDGLKDEQREMRRTISDQAQEMKRLVAENSKVKERIVTLERERDELRRERDALRLEREELNAKVYRLECEVEDLKKRGTGPLPDLAEAVPVQPEPGQEPSEATNETPSGAGE